MVDVLDCLHLRLDGRVFGIRLLVSGKVFFLSLCAAAAAAIVVVAARVYFCIRSERD